MKEKFIVRFSWIIFLLIGIVVLGSSIPHILGVNTDPTLVQTISGKTIDELKSTSPSFFGLYNYYFSGGGLSDFGFAFFLITISITAFRKGVKWAWFSFWVIPVYFFIWILLSNNLPEESKMSLIPPLTVFIVLSLLGLCLSFRNFFPKKH